MTTLSTLGHVAACPGSASLPRFAREGDRAPTLGRAIHEVLQHRVGGYNAGSTFDVARLAYVYGLDTADAGRLAFLAQHLRLPVPSGALAEVPLGYWPDGSVRRVTGGAGRYVDEGQILSGTIDVMWAEPEPIEIGPDGWGPTATRCMPGSTLWVCDYKTGAEEHVPPIDRNWQLRGAAVLAARWTGATRVIPAICYVNAAECAEAVREGRVFEGRWGVGAPLDAAALDVVEAEMRAVLARARGEGDGHGRKPQAEGGPDPGTGREREVVLPQPAPLILGPHCDHCAARGACPALAAEAVNLLGALEERDEDRGRDNHGRGSADVPASVDGGGEVQEVEREAPQARGAAGVVRRDRGTDPGEARQALTRARAAHLAGIIPALRRILDAAEVAVRAHVHATGAPLALADGREYGPALEEVRSYRTRPTYEVLAEVVGEVAADEAFLATADRLKAALRGERARLPRGAWAAFEEELEARGAVVVGAREVWRTRWPAKPAEVGDGRAEDVARRVRLGDCRDGGRGGEASPGSHGREGPDPSGDDRRLRGVEQADAQDVGGRGLVVDGDAGGMVDRREGQGVPLLNGVLTDAPPMDPGPHREPVPQGVRDSAPPDGGEGVAAPGAPDGGPARALDGGRDAVSRAPCSVCGQLFSVTKAGVMRKHLRPDGALYCLDASGKTPAPAKPSEQLQIVGA